jgi:hypothetical protein
MKQILSALVLAVALCAPTLIFPSYSQTPSTSQGGSTSQRKSTPRDSAKSTCTDNGTYTNSQGQKVKRPENCSSPPVGATAQCRDTTYSFSMSRRGTCSHHGGVAKWL